MGSEEGNMEFRIHKQNIQKGSVKYSIGNCVQGEWGWEMDYKNGEVERRNKI